MKHLVRAGGLLVIVLISVLIVPRVIPTPAFLTEFGFHQRNRTGNTELWASLPIQYAGVAVCSTCHQDKYGMWQKGKHRAVSCENCHGPASAHVESGTPEVLNTSRELCGTCHAQLTGRPSSFPQVDMAVMGGDEKCIVCHNPHEPRVGMPPEVPHALTGRTDCLLCHGQSEPWVEPPPQYPHTLEGRSDCLSCHGPPEIRGANLPHPPHSLEGRSDCLVCHGPGKIRPVPRDHEGRTSPTCLNCHRVE